jgi:hypothetical protein
VQRGGVAELVARIVVRKQGRRGAGGGGSLRPDRDPPLRSPSGETGGDLICAASASRSRIDAAVRQLR